MGLPATHCGRSSQGMRGFVGEKAGLKPNLPASAARFAIRARLTDAGAKH